MAMNNQTKLIVNAHFDRSTVSTDGGIRHLVVNLQGPDAPQRESDDIRSLNLGIVIDASGSMDSPVSGRDLRDRLERQEKSQFGSCLEAAKAAAIGVVESLSTHDRLSVVSFSDEAEVHLSGDPMDEAGKRQAIDRISRIRTRGCTNLHDGWLKGAELVAQIMDGDAAYQNRVVVLSDGLANRGIIDPGSLGEIAGGLRERGITTSTVGIGADYSTEQLEQIAVQGGGMLHHAQEADEIVEVLMGELGSIQNTFAENLVLDCSLAHNGTVLDGRILGLPFHREANGLRCPVGFVMCGQTRQVVIRLDVPEGLSAGGFDVVLNLRWKALNDGGRQQRCRRTVSLKIAEGASEASLDIEVGQMVAKMWLAEIVRRSMVMNQDGDYDGVQAFLKVEIADFKAYCAPLPDGDDLVIKAERTRRTAIQPMMMAMNKEVHTAQFKMMRGSRDTRHKVRESSWVDLLDK
jgi:Ca-activated chloride channel homolog